MADFVDRLADLLRSLWGGGAARGGGAGSGEKPRFTDPDVARAWEELDDFMRGGAPRPGTDSTGTGDSRGPRGGRQQAGGRRSPGEAGPASLEDLRQDYANLEVPFGADIDTLKRAYKAQIMRYHPDKHAADPEKLRVATEITKKINESYERIRTRIERNGPSS
jgi:DnaJ-domain-containing protein 1